MAAVLMHTLSAPARKNRPYIVNGAQPTTYREGNKNLFGRF